MAGVQSPADTAHSSMGSSDVEQASSAASSISQPTSRRGGYMDSGGYTKSGELPTADSVYVTTDRELKQELDSILKKLSPTAEWTVRIQALLRLEGVVLGGAPSFHAFLELFRPLQDPIITQLLDRRSAVSRQACQLICVLSQAMGSQFDSLAVQIMPALFKVLVITVQVMADAAHECIRAIVTNSHSWRIVQRISDAICKDRSPKLRLCCAEYLAQVIHDWDAVEYERSTDALESAIKAAVQDALSETRNAGRAAFSAYSRARPDRVSAVLASVDNSLRQKLKEGLLEGLPPLDRMAPAPAKPPARRQSAIPALHTARDAAGPARHLSGKPPPRGRFSIAAPAEAAALAQSQLPAQPQPPPARASMKPRKSLAGAALRINLPVDATGVYGDRRQTAYSGPTASAMQPPASMDLHLSSSEYVSSCSHSDDSAAAVPFAQLLSNAAAGGSDWKIRVDGFESLTAALCSPSGAHGVAANLDRLVALFVENIGESHAKVAAACLHALAAAFSTAGSQLERHLDRLLPPLLLRAVDGKEPIRRAASQALTILPGSVSADAYLAALTGAVGSKKSIKAQVAAMESFIAAAKQRLLPGSQIIPHILREWVERLTTLAVDKHLEVRRTAEQALARVHSLVDSSVLHEHLDAVDLASDIRTTLLQILQVASAADALEARPAEECSQEAQQTQLAAVPQSCTYPSDMAEVDRDSRLRLSQNSSVGADEPAASLSLEVEAGQAGSALGHSAQQEPLRAQPTVLLPMEESADSENGQAADQTPSSLRLPSPHLQREALSPLLDASNFRNQPAAPQATGSPKLESPLSMRTPGSKLFSLSQFATPPTALPVRRAYGSMADAQAHVEMLMDGVKGPLPLLCLQALPAALASTPSAVWEPMLSESMLPALKGHALHGELEVRKAALLGLEAVGRHAVLLEMGHLEGIVPGLLTCCCDASREVCMLAQQALEAIAGKLPRQQAFQKFVDALCKEQQDAMGEAPVLQVLLRCCGVLVKKMGRAEADAALQGDLMPALVRAFQHSSADVRKAVVFLLVDAWKQVGQDLMPYLKDLSTSQQKLVAIYIERASQLQM